MLDIQILRKTQVMVIALGSYPAIMQSILDFDYVSGKKEPSIRAIIAAGRNYERYFWGTREVLIPVFPSVSDVPKKIRGEANFFISLSSGRRTRAAAEEALSALPALIGGIIFAENVPEQHAIALYEQAQKRKIFLTGPASIGIILPSVMKLGAIGGVDVRQLTTAHLFTPGSVAVLSSSGGMTNEIINTVTHYGKRISFSLSFGGERFPMTTPEMAFLAAEKDPQTKTIVYFGELGGTDEALIAELLKAKKITKKVICYIAGTVAEMFATPPQFGHAKAMASTQEESARGKRTMLRQAGAQVADSYAEFLEQIQAIPEDFVPEGVSYAFDIDRLINRQRALITTSISGVKNGQPQLLGEDLLTIVKQESFASLVMSMFLGKKIRSKELEGFTDFTLRLLADHGPYVSGAVNTIVTARAGRDLVSSLAAGLLTIGPRFGGAINQAAANWLTGVTSEKDPASFVEEFASKRQYISGIGHKKYRIDAPDPRVKEIKHFIKSLTHKRFTNFALSVEKITTAKKGNLILNVDGAIAAVLLDLLSEKEGVSDRELKRLVASEFFNAIFVLSRSVGFISHFLDQKRLDEGIFRLPENLVSEAEIQS